MFKRYIEGQKIDINSRHKLGWTSLMTAAVNGRYQMCKYLLSNGADPNLGDNYINSHRTASTQGLHSIEGKVALASILGLFPIPSPYWYMN